MSNEVNEYWKLVLRYNNNTYVYVSMYECTTKHLLSQLAGWLAGSLTTDWPILVASSSLGGNRWPDSSSVCGRTCDCALEKFVHYTLTVSCVCHTCLPNSRIVLTGLTHARIHIYIYIYIFVYSF